LAQTLSAKCPHCGHIQIVVSQHDGKNYEGYRPRCGSPLFGFFTLAEKAGLVEKKDD